MKQYRPIESRILTPKITGAAWDKLSPSEQERINRQCEMLADSIRNRRNTIGDVTAREIVAAIGRLLCEDQERRTHGKYRH